MRPMKEEADPMLKQTDYFVYRSRLGFPMFTKKEEVHPLVYCYPMKDARDQEDLQIYQVKHLRDYFQFIAEVNHSVVGYYYVKIIKLRYVFVFMVLFVRHTIPQHEDEQTIRSNVSSSRHWQL